MDAQTSLNPLSSTGPASPTKKLTYAPIDPKGIPLRFLIVAHGKKSSSPKTLHYNLGDAFLYRNNAVFRIIRNDYLQRGFRFGVRDFCDYNAFPLMALDDLIEAGKIPYLRNFHWIERIHKIAPDKFTCSEVLRFGLKSNYLLHESAHFIAHDVFFGQQRLCDAPKNADTLLQILLGEAFANSVEALSSMYATGTFAPFFLQANIYFHVLGTQRTELICFAEKYGFMAAAKTLFGSFVYANYLYCFLEKPELERIRQFAGLGSDAPIEEIANIALTLSAGFRTNTTPLHLLKIGFDHDLQKQVDYDPLDLLAESRNERICSQLKALFQIFGREASALELRRDS